MQYLGSYSALINEKWIYTANKLKIASVLRVHGNEYQMSFLAIRRDVLHVQAPENERCQIEGTSNGADATVTSFCIAQWAQGHILSKYTASAQ